jgi:hypothetical protein
MKTDAMTLRRWIRHDGGCPAWSVDDDNCTCGLWAALAAERVRPALDVAALAPLIDEIYQRGLDAPEAAAFILAALQAKDAP